MLLPGHTRSTFVRVATTNGVVAVSSAWLRRSRRREQPWASRLGFGVKGTVQKGGTLEHKHLLLLLLFLTTLTRCVYPQMSAMQPCTKHESNGSVPVHRPLPPALTTDTTPAALCPPLPVCVCVCLCVCVCVCVCLCVVLCGCCVVVVWLLCGCCVVVVWLLCGCCVVVVWLLCGCCVVVVWLCCGCCVVVLVAVAVAVGVYDACIHSVYIHML